MTIYETHRELVAEFDSVEERLGEANNDKVTLDLARHLIRLAEQLVNAAPNDADAHQMLGFAWYQFPQQRSWSSWHCRTALERALRIDPAHPWARKFLGYHLFDQERYANALRHFNKLDLEFFDHPNREWEILKIHELRQVCQIRISPTELPDDFASFCVSYIGARTREDESVDLGSTVPLQELPECAEWLLEQGTESSSTPLCEILRSSVASDQK